MPHKEIIVCTQGWVLMGVPELDEYGVTLRNAAVIRVWGTTKGIGEIAIHGPTPKTILDPVGETRIPHHAVVQRIKCVYEDKAA